MKFAISERKSEYEEKLTRSGLSVGVSARRASLLLLVERHLAASSASSVGLRVSLTKTLGTLGLLKR